MLWRFADLLRGMRFEERDGGVVLGLGGHDDRGDRESRDGRGHDGYDGYDGCGGKPR